MIILLLDFVLNVNVVGEYCTNPIFLDEQWKNFNFFLGGGGGGGRDRFLNFIFSIVKPFSFIVISFPPHYYFHFYSLCTFRGYCILLSVCDFVGDL